MKTRIISGIIMAAIVVGVLVLGFLVSPYFITAFIAIVAAVGCYELIHNAAGIKSKAAVYTACVYTALSVILRDGTLYLYVTSPLITSFYDENKKLVYLIASNWSVFPTILTVLYFIFSVCVILKCHKDFDLAKIVTLSAMPLFLSYAFSSLGAILNHTNGLFYLLLLLNFSSVCDMGAYFVGVTLGKHKLCPEISPKKTVEGALGGIASSIIFSIVIVLSFSLPEKLIATLILTIPLCILGMLGDLFASSIKRAVNLKDYGSLIPGHGGILDRVDSILMIAPLLYLCIRIGVL